MRETFKLLGVIRIGFCFCQSLLYAGIGKNNRKSFWKQTMTKQSD